MCVCVCVCVYVCVCGGVCVCVVLLDGVLTPTFENTPAWTILGDINWFGAKASSLMSTSLKVLGFVNYRQFRDNSLLVSAEARTWENVLMLLYTYIAILEQRCGKKYNIHEQKPYRLYITLKQYTLD